MAVVLAGALVAGPAQAAPGDIDQGFGTGGKVITDIGSASFDAENAVAIQSDGKIVAAGRSDFRYFALVRYKADGSLDASFGSGGKALTDFGSDNNGAQAVAIQADGKIVAAGFGQTTGGFDFALVRYNVDGSIDSSFGSGGKVLTDFGSNSDFAQAVAIQADGKIVVAGSSDANGTADFALARYTVDGSLDTSFGSGGKMLTDVGPGNVDVGFAVALQADARIVAAGFSYSGSSGSDFALVRYTVDGSLATSFGSGGKVLTDVGTASADAATAVALQANGKIVAAGQTNASGGSQTSRSSATRSTGASTPASARAARW